MTLNINKSGALDAMRTELSRNWLRVRKLVWHKVLRTAHQNSRTVFLVGSGRSGTDILAYCLSRTLAVKLINETDQLAFENWRLKPLDEVSRVVASAGAPLVLFKPIVETMRVQELLEAFPDSRALFLVRDYRDAINSMASFFGERHVNAVTHWVKTEFSPFPLVPRELRSLVKQVWKDAPSVESACGIYWLVYNSSWFFLDLERDTRIRIVNYEKLVMEPEGILRGVCAFLGLKYRNAMIADVYSSSVKRKPAPRLPAVLDRHCEETWNRLRECCTST